MDNPENLPAQSITSGVPDQIGVAAKSVERKSDSVQEQYASENVHENSISVTDHGFTNGTLLTDARFFQEFLTADAELKFYRDQVEKLNEETKGLYELKASTQEKINNTQSELTSVKSEIVSREKELLLLNERIGQSKTDANGVENELKSFKSEYSWIAVSLYLLAAVIFIVADFGISHSIVADTLEIAGIEGILFAAGLASISILLKPLYDRLVESKYTEKTHVKRFSVSIIFVSFLAITLLVLLGMFRFQTRDAIVAAQTDIEQGVQFDPDAGNVNERSSAADESFSPTSGWIGMWSFVLSGVLFAVAGAICLGIALPVVQRRRQKILLMRREKALRDVITALCDRRLGVEQFLATALGNKEKHEHILNSLPSLSDLQQEHTQAKNILSTAIREMSLVQSKRSVALYMDAYERGTKMDGDFVKEKFNEETRITNEILLEPLRGNATKSTGLGSRSRPFVAIRKMIASDFRNRINSNSSDNIIDYTID